MYGTYQSPADLAAAGVVVAQVQAGHGSGPAATFVSVEDVLEAGGGEGARWGHVHVK